MKHCTVAKAVQSFHITLPKERNVETTCSSGWHFIRVQEASQQFQVFYEIKLIHSDINLTQDAKPHCILSYHYPCSLYMHVDHNLVQFANVHVGMLN